MSPLAAAPHGEGGLVPSPQTQFRGAALQAQGPQLSQEAPTTVCPQMTA